MQTKIHIAGIHCKSCKTLIETDVSALKGVKSVQVNAATGATILDFDPQKISLAKITATIEKLNYCVVKEAPTKSRKNFRWALILAALFVVAMVIIKKTNALALLAYLDGTYSLSYGFIFLIGLLTGFHCVGMCGGFVVAYTAGRSEAEKRFFAPHWQYNLGRVLSYTAVGAILGGFGSFFGVNPVFTAVITLLAGFFMTMMGLALFTEFRFLEKIKLHTPLFIAKYLYRQSHTKTPKGPFLVGLLNGLMPCGPLQAMQLYALASGSVLAGALSLGVYALGTVPLMFGFGAFISLLSRERVNQVVRFSGLLVLILGLLMFNRGLLSLGYGFRDFAPTASVGTVAPTTDNNKEVQVVKMAITYNGYSPNVLYVKKGVPVRWVIDAKQISGCTDAIILHGYDIEKDLVKGENVIEFTPRETGEIKFSCGMQMVWGKFIVAEGDAECASGEVCAVGD